jgi:MoaA/NifB/PqqE/SkfB family radical SAM enzyme
LIDLLPARKRIASLFLLPDCDMRCRFCASEDDFSVMSLSQAAELLEALRALGLRNVVFGGGEPFLWPHGIERLTGLARDLGFLVQVCTNGVSLPAGFDGIDSIDRYILPLESIDPHVHDALRPHPGGHHRLVLDRIESLAGSEKQLTVSTVVTRDNVDRLDGLAEFLVRTRDRGVDLHAWHLYRFLPVGRGGTASAGRLAIDDDRFMRACSAVKGLGLPFRVFRRDNMLRSSSVEFFWFENDRLEIGSRVAVNRY